MRKVYQLVKSQGYDVFIDHDISSGIDFREKIMTQLKDSDCVVTFWSSSAVKSRYVIDEAEYAMAHGVLIPVLLDETMPPFGFGDINAANLSEWDGDEQYSELDKLFNAIKFISSGNVDSILEIQKGLNKILDPLPRKDYREFKSSQSNLNESVIEILNQVKDIQGKTSEAMLKVKQALI